MFVSGQDLPRIEPQARFVQLSMHSGDLTESQFIDAALLASGTSIESNERDEIDQLIRDLVNDLGSNKNAYDKGEQILQYLHDSVFSRYIENQTKIDTLIRRGTFNCVSSAVLYMAAGRAAGLNIQGVQTPDHAFVSVLIDSDIVDVETTNEWGYDPGKKKEFTDSFSGSTGYNYVPPGNYSLRKDINDKQMIGLILQNRIAELQRINNHKDAVPMAVDRYSLTLSDVAQKDMYDTFSNYASQLNGSGQYEKGITFLLEAINRWNSSSNVSKAIEALIHNYLLSLIENDQSLEAENYLSMLEAQEVMSPEAVQSDRAMIYDKRTIDLLNSDSSFAEIQPYLNRIYEEGFLLKDKWINYTLYNYIQEAEIVAGSQGWLKAYLFVKDAPVKIRNQRKYIQLLNSCKRNYVVTIHNSFADLYNSGKYSEAEELINEGLEQIPGDRTLTSDLQMIKNKSF